MADGKAPLGPRKFNVAGQHDEDFDELCFQLIRLEFPGAVKMRAPDGGADALLPRQGTADGYERCWQAKRYPGDIHWPHCIESLDRAVERYQPDRVTFCFPKNLTEGEEAKFDEKLRQRHPEITVDYWNGSELAGRLISSQEGERVARYFFGQEVDLAAMERAFQAGGLLQSGEQALERSLAIGEFLAGHDPYFSYPSGQREVGTPAPAPSEETAMRVEMQREEVIAHADAVPRHAEAIERYGPKGRVIFADTDAGKEARERLGQVMKEGGELLLEEGAASLTFDQLPPLFKEFVGRPMEGRMRFQVEEPAVPPPWPARVEVESDRGDAAMDFDLGPSAEPPEGWDVALQDTRGGLTLTVLFRWDHETNKGEMRVNWSYTMDLSPARDQLAAVRLLNALHGRGTFRLNDRSETRPTVDITMEGKRPDELLKALQAVFADITTIEEWTGAELPIPAEGISRQEVVDLARVAQTIRDRGHSVNFEAFTANVLPSALPEIEEGREIMIGHTLDAEVLGQVVHLGQTKMKLPRTKIASIHALADDAKSRCKIRVVPADAESASVWVALEGPPRGNAA
jgi:hypothetical protein